MNIPLFMAWFFTFSAISFATLRITINDIQTPTVVTCYAICSAIIASMFALTHLKERKSNNQNPKKKDHS